MKNSIPIGSTRIYKHTVTEADIAEFSSGVVHEVYSTFALTRDAEWSGRLFVLDMKEEGEEGIGTYISSDHMAPAFLGEEVIFTSTLEGVYKNEVATSYIAKVGQRIVAHGEQKQKIVDKERLDKSFAAIQNSDKSEDK